MSIHRHHHRRALLTMQVVVLACVVCPIAYGTAPPARRALTDPPTPQEIDRLVDDLGHVSYEVRTYATRRLLAIGLPARQRLLEAEQSDLPEVVLRSKQLLHAYDSLLYHGLRVELSFSKTRIAWNETVDLTVTLINDSNFEARVLLETDATERDQIPPDSRQVADMLDISESLRVVGPTERNIGLRVDDINLDPHVGEVVQARLGTGPIGRVPPKSRVAITVRDFNRGWARLPLLDAGRYVVQFDFMPRWEDPKLVESEVGRVQSQPTILTVTAGAPAAVSRRGVEASLTVERDGEDLVAKLVNRTDQTRLINRNFGAAPPFAHGRWVYDRNGNMREISSIDRPGASWHDFQKDQLVSVAPGDSIELTRIAQDELVKRLVTHGAQIDGGTEWELYFTYSNLCDRNWQKRQGDALLGAKNVPEVLRELLPRHILTGWHTSNRISVSNTK